MPPRSPTIPATTESQADVTDESLAMLITALNESDGMKLWMDTSLGANIGKRSEHRRGEPALRHGTPEDIVKAMNDAAAKG